MSTNNLENEKVSSLEDIQSLLPQKTQEGWWTNEQKEITTPQFVFSGTGTSEGVPIVSCLTGEQKNCVTCRRALQFPQSRNRRRNTGGVIRIPDKESGQVFNVLIDCGKFFFESAMDIFPMYDIRRLDGLLLTHEHFDAIGGLDNLRDWTIRKIQETVNVYCEKKTFDTVAQMFPYIVDVTQSTGSGLVPSVNFTMINEAKEELTEDQEYHDGLPYISEPFYVSEVAHLNQGKGLKVIPLPAAHGKNMICLGFRFGNVSYVSDAETIPDCTKALMEGSEIIVLDALLKNGSHSSHFCLPQALEFVAGMEIKPKRVLLVGMNHTWEHERDNKMIEEARQKIQGLEDVKIELAWDGLSIDIEVGDEEEEGKEK